MVENEPLRMALEHYRQRRAGKLKEIQDLEQMIARLSRDLGETAQAAQADEDEDSSETGISEAWQESEYGPTTALKNGAKVNLRPDEFFGMTYSGAATAYLEKVRHAVSMDELLDALNRGGCPVGGREPRKTLYISLIRDVRTFVPISGTPGFLGLRKFYPNLKTLKGKEPRAKNKKAKKKKPGRKENAAKATAEPKTAALTAHPPVSAKKDRPAVEQADQKGGAEK
jgi:hypothetical protein